MTFPEVPSHESWLDPTLYQTVPETMRFQLFCGQISKVVSNHEFVRCVSQVVKSFFVYSGNSFILFLLSRSLIQPLFVTEQIYLFNIRLPIANCIDPCLYKVHCSLLVVLLSLGESDESFLKLVHFNI